MSPPCLEPSGLAFPSLTKRPGEELPSPPPLTSCPGPLPLCPPFTKLQPHWPPCYSSGIPIRCSFYVAQEPARYWRHCIFLWTRLCWNTDLLAFCFHSLGQLSHNARRDNGHKQPEKPKNIYYLALYRKVCHAPTWSTFPSGNHTMCFLTSFKSLLKYDLLSEAFPQQPTFKKQPCHTHPLVQHVLCPIPCLIFF